MLYCSIPPAHGLRRPQAHALVYTLVADRPGSNELSDVRTQLWEDRLRQAQAIPRRAIERGELAADTDPAAMIDMLVGPIYLRRFVQGRPMTATEIDDLATRVVAAFTPRLPPGSTAPGVARITGGSPATTLTPRTLRRIPRRCRPWRAATTTSAPSTSQFHDHYCGQTVAAKRPGQLSAAATSASSITGRGAHPVVAAAVAGDPGSDGDQAGPDGGAAGPGVEREASTPAARVRLAVMAARVSQAAFAGKCPEGWASGPSFQSAKTCSMMAWSRWCASAWIVSNGLSVKTAW
jgi:hypothetical protein